VTVAVFLQLTLLLLQPMQRTLVALLGLGGIALPDVAHRQEE
jgi:hypothetical protein